MKITPGGILSDPIEIKKFFFSFFGTLNLKQRYLFGILDPRGAVGSRFFLAKSCQIISWRTPFLRWRFRLGDPGYATDLFEEIVC